MSKWNEEDRARVVAQRICDFGSKNILDDVSEALEVLARQFLQADKRVAELTDALDEANQDLLAQEDR